MCGITGFLSPRGLAPTAQGDLARMMGQLAHRGPDSAGAWLDAGAGVALGHRRLSILDLSVAGAQPMVSHSGRYVLSTNGEIYNHGDIRDELARNGDAIAWRGHSDTETMVAAFDRWGVEPTLQRMVGMFAFAVWDRQERALTLARDRLGEKPLFWGWQRGTLLFGSELKALRTNPDFEARIDRDQLNLYMHRGYVPHPGSIYVGIHKLSPGCLVRFRCNDPLRPIQEIVCYWSIRESIEECAREPFGGSDDDALLALEKAVGRAVVAQSVADVPLGAFLSGGVDSSTVVALMQANASRPVRTFSIGFTEERFNEAPYAKAVAAHLGTDHSELIVTPREAMAVIPRLPSLYDEPFGDSSAIPTFLVSQLARRHVTVSLSGDGGDELFGGYTRYARAEKFWRLLRRVPRSLRTAIAPLAGRHLSYFAIAASPQDLYDRVMLDREAPGVVLCGDPSPPGASVVLDSEFAGRSVTHAMMLADIETYLSDDILVKVDRASMGVSLESRVPLLDHRVVEFAWRLPVAMKVRGSTTKWLLRRLLHKYVPERLFDRRKMGFGVPVADWLRADLRDWAESLLAEDFLQRDGFLDARQVRRIWSAHVDGTPRLGLMVWRLLMFQAWLAAERQA